MYKYLNSSSKDEDSTVLKWILDDDSNYECEQFLFEYWNLLPDRLEDGVSKGENHLLDRIHHTINLNRANEVYAIRKYRRLVRVAFNSFVRVAAVLLTVLLSINIGIYFIGSKPKEKVVEQQYKVTAPFGSVVNIKLPDGSKVWLNQGSTLTYPLFFSEKKRVVKLFGEAFFEVVHDEQKPFLVKTMDAEVRVLGTSFNVFASADRSLLEVTLQKGSVDVLADDGSNRFGISRVKEGQHMSLDLKSRKYSLSAVNISRFISWKDGKQVFIDDSIQRVLSKLSEWYRVKVVLVDESLKDLTYTATFINEPLEDVLEKLQSISPISYRILGGEPLLNGGFREKRVLIFKKERR